jgi:hypothetical protein
VLAKDAAQRDQENKSPRAEVALLKHSGLTKLLAVSGRLDHLVSYSA